MKNFCLQEAVGRRLKTFMMVHVARVQLIEMKAVQLTEGSL